MPAFYQNPSTAGQMPLTPPDSGSGYYSNMHFSQDPYAAHSSMSQPIRHDSGYDYQPSYPPATQSYYQQSSYSTTSLPPISNFYEPMSAPILPPLRIHDRVPFADDYSRRLQQEQQNAAAAAQEQQRQAAKEEKATGGVSAKLDYEMEQMTDFVTEATQTIFRHTMQSQTSFRKWVHQVLSATRLPSATILLSLHYLNERIANHPETIQPGDNQIYRLLAVSLILGSKFLDDNTFINRSWSDVTAIKVHELNYLEMVWLNLINFRLHVDPSSQNGIQEWLKAWSQYEAKYIAKQKQQQQAARLSPLDTTNVYRHHNQHRERYSPYPSPYSNSSTRSYETPLTSRSTYFGTPSYGSADPWSHDRLALEDFYKRQHRYPTLSEMNDDASRRASEERARQASYAYSSNSHCSYYQPSNYNSSWDHCAWNGAHRYDCACSACSYQQHYRPYSMASSYTAQTVMG